MIIKFLFRFRLEHRNRNSDVTVGIVGTGIFIPVPNTSNIYAWCPRWALWARGWARAGNSDGNVVWGTANSKYKWYQWGYDFQMLIIIDNTSCYLLFQEPQQVHSTPHQKSPDVKQVYWLDVSCFWQYISHFTVSGFEKQVLETLANMNIQIRKLTEEVAALRSERGRNLDEASIWDDIAFPLTDAREVLQLERKLQDKALQRKLVRVHCAWLQLKNVLNLQKKHLKTIWGPDVKKQTCAAHQVLCSPLQLVRGGGATNTRPQLQERHSSQHRLQE